MALRDHVAAWFKAWEDGEYQSIPVTDAFTHESPYGTVDGKTAYLDLVGANTASFLGFRFEIHDELYGESSACVRYTGHKGDFSLDASEWFFGDERGISRIVSYYNLGEISYEEMD